MKIAYCLVGLVSIFSDLHLPQTLKRLLLEPLDADLFMHVDHREDIFPHKELIARRETSMKEIFELATTFGAKSARVAHLRTPDDFCTKRGIWAERARASWPAWEHGRSCIEMVIAHESNATYDWIFVARPEYLVRQRVNVSDIEGLTQNHIYGLLSNYNGGYELADGMYLLSRENGKLYANLIATVNALCESNFERMHSLTSICPAQRKFVQECLQKILLSDFGRIQVQKLPVQAIRLRRCGSFGECRKIGESICNLNPSIPLCKSASTY